MDVESTLVLSLFKERLNFFQARALPGDELNPKLPFDERRLAIVANDEGPTKVQ